MNEKVSVIIPMYNLEDCCTYCLKSVLNQTYRDIEVIIVDDGSTDNTLEECKKIAALDNRIHLVSKKNGGVSSARNVGLANATGKYITFVDGDDIISTKYIEKLLNQMTENTCAVISAHIRIFDYNSQVFEEKDCNIERIDADSALEKLLRGQFPVSVWAVLFNRSRILDIRFPKRIKHNEDKYFIFKTLLKNPDTFVVRMSEKLYGYCVRRSSVTQQQWSGSTDVVKVADQIYREIKEQNPKYLELAQNAMIDARIQVLRDMVKAPRTMRQYRKIYIKYKKQILKTGYQPSFRFRVKVEYIALRIGDVTFRSLVNLYYRLFNENMRFKFNEKQIDIRKSNQKDGTK